MILGWIGLSRVRRRGFPRLPGWGGWSLVAIAPLLLATAFVVPQRIWPGVPAGGPRPASTASIAFVQPAPGESVAGETLEIRIELDGGRIVAETTTDLSPDTGHVHVFLDGSLVSMAYGVQQEVDIGGLEPGPHRLLAEFVAADHAPFDPRVTAAVAFVTEGT